VAPTVDDVVEDFRAVEVKEPEEVHSYWGRKPETYKTPIEAAFEETVEEIEEEPEDKLIPIAEHSDHAQIAAVGTRRGRRRSRKKKLISAHYVEELEEDDFVEMERK